MTVERSVNGASKGDIGLCDGAEGKTVQGVKRSTGAENPLLRSPRIRGHARAEVTCEGEGQEKQKDEWAIPCGGGI